MNPGENIVPNQEKQRIKSLDFFRGLTIAAMILVNDPGSWEHVYPPLLHAKWHGWTPTDLIFPFFLFIVGVSITLAMSKKTGQQVIKKQTYGKIIRRTLILFGLGLFLNSFPVFDFSIIRIPGVLQRIAICYFITSIIYLNSSFRIQIFWAAFFLFFYWIIMEWGAFLLNSMDTYGIENNFAGYIDRLFLTGHMWTQTKTWDPEGIISTLPAISTTLFGILTGQLLVSKYKPLEKIILMLVYGNALIVTGLIWSHWMPINKNLWTGSYCVFMAGIAMVSFGISFYIIDIKHWTKGIKTFVIFGMNAVTIYVLSEITAILLYLISWIDTSGNVVSLQEWIVSTLFMSWLSTVNASLFFAFGFVAVSFIPVYFMYKKKIFIKI